MHFQEFPEMWMVDNKLTVDRNYDLFLGEQLGTFDYYTVLCLSSHTMFTVCVGFLNYFLFILGPFLFYIFANSLFTFQVKSCEKIPKKQK